MVYKAASGYHVLLFQAAIKSSVRLEFDTKTKAVQARLKLYAARNKLIKSGHELAHLFDQIVIRGARHDESTDQWYIVLEPAGWELKAQLERLGLLEKEDEEVDRKSAIDKLYGE